jgi:hypothetical protein
MLHRVERLPAVRIDYGIEHASIQQHYKNASGEEQPTRSVIR